jgi:hypothetical protein
MKDNIKLMAAGLTVFAIFIYFESFESSPLPSSKGEIQRPLKGPDLERWYFSDWHQPYTNILPWEVMQKMWTDINNLPDERETDYMTAAPWKCIGPFGMNVTSPNIKHSGRILDVYGPSYIGSASGGLWLNNTVLGKWVPLSDSLTSLAIGTFCLINSGWLAGTGEPFVRRGTGLWRTTNMGANWTNIAMNPAPNSHPKWFYKIREDGTWGYIGWIHAATDTGYYRSTDFGTTWTRTLAGEVSDMTQHPDGNQPQDLFAAVWGGTNQGIWRSTNLGASWTKLSGGLPTTNIGRTSLSFSVRIGSFPLYTALYTSIARLDNNNFMGVYKSTDKGDTWTNVTSNLPASVFGNQGWYDNIIAAERSHPDTVIVGGVSLYRSFNGGGSWTLINDVNVHADHHRADFSMGIAGLFECNDGGLSHSTNAGLNWSTVENKLPITQYYGFDVGKSNANVILGGAQDVGISGTVNGGTNWMQVHYPGIGGDGAGIAIDPNNSSNVYGILGVYGGAISFQRFRSNDAGQTWTGINGGIAADGNWAPNIRCEKNNGQTLYTNANNFVYKSTNGGGSWFTLNTTGFTYNVANVNVSVGSGTPVIYACLNSTTDAANKLKVYDGGTWYERSTGLPTGARVRTVAQHPNNNNRAYALMNGLGVPPTQGPHKIFKTFNRGVTWIDITGDLPDIPVGDLVPHPTDTNILYLGTEMGCYKTENGGASWVKWNTGMPKANIITEMTFLDSTAQNGKFYILAASYGRSIWIRQIDELLTAVQNNNREIPERFSLEQNYPNPFNNKSKIKYQISKMGMVRLTVFDILGREVAVGVNQELQPGIYEITLDAANFASGIYFYQLVIRNYESGIEFEGTKRMMLVK